MGEEQESGASYGTHAGQPSRIDTGTGVGSGGPIANEDAEGVSGIHDGTDGEPKNVAEGQTDDSGSLVDTPSGS